MMELQDKCKQLLNLWISQEDGSGIYKYSGRYWEVLFPLLQKYAPEELKAYENKVGEEFEYFNDDIRKKITTYNENEDYTNAMNFINARIDNYAKPNDVDYVELEEDEIIPYIPNQNIDITKHFGRDEE